MRVKPLEESNRGISCREIRVALSKMIEPSDLVVVVELGTALLERLSLVGLLLAVGCLALGFWFGVDAAII